MSKNSYALQLQARRAMEDKTLIVDNAQLCLSMMTVALNEEFGFGRERLLRLAGRFNDLFGAYHRLMDDDRELADARLRERVARIMREDAP